ncbi:antibiotic biosynthesis monooxygenase [Nannocystis sp. ILAH1]|uniref:putative quinol monooxygenase n=1 Tax=unclassified Nannocystis TaxID=2627009 RepID=UPI002271B1BB|nr:MULTISPECIES: antibiotic biosynthesis monooxygenase [unclassified Nannocystis]MCY0992878.1 antibiotic biosynthesis monooxygenase [Nannocystis sp. ILAH1]MCY1066284.1 antibiotic biosynthesis monooxygenase [Nannocystis sp. RBIL2]
MPVFNSSILAVVKLSVERAALDRALALLQELAERSRSARGCSRFEVLQEAADPTQLVTVERWDGDASADAHMRSPHVTVALARLTPLLRASPRFARYRSVER